MLLPFFIAEVKKNLKVGGPYRVRAGASVAPVSVAGIRVLAVVLGRLHLKDVGNDAVDGDVSYQASEEELFCDAGVHEPQRRQSGQDPSQSEKQKPFFLLKVKNKSREVSPINYRVYVCVCVHVTHTYLYMSSG